MRLTPHQLRSLRFSLEHRDKDLPAVGLLLTAWKAQAVLVGVVGVGAAFLWMAGAQIACMVLVGFMVGSLSRDHLWAQSAQRNWRLNREITNWTRVEELVAENTPSSK